MTEPKLPVAIGEMVAGKYLVDRVLGMGGMGVVLAATHVELGQKVAIKFLLAEARAVTGMAHRFANEAKASARLRSAHVARILDVGALDDGTPYMVMEYLDGRDLAAILTERTRIGIHEACDYVLQACEALAEAHARGIIHRDLKPGNLFVARTADGGEIVKLLDFGISKHVAPEGADFSLTKTSAVLGSPLYMPPEQMSSARTVDSRADLWSLGVVLYEAVTGTMPFEGLTLTGLVANIIQDPPRPMTVSGAAVPAVFQAIVFRCLEKTPARRYETVGELARALADFAPRASLAAVDRITRLEEQNPALKHAPRPAQTPSEPPMQLVRRRAASLPEVSVPRDRPPPAGGVTHAAQMLDARRPRRLARTAPREDGSRGPGVVIGVLVATGAILLTFLFVRPPRDSGAAPPEVAPSVPAAPPPPLVAPPPPAPPPEDPLPAVDAAMPAPPATFSAESPSAPPSASALAPVRGAPVVRGPGPSPDHRRAAPAPPPSAPSPTPAAPPQAPRPAGTVAPSLEMVPK